MKLPLIILTYLLGLLSLSKAQDCGGFIVNECQRDVCPYRNEEKVGSLELCQLLCDLGSVDVENCQSWAYHEDLQVSSTHCSKSSFFVQKINFDFPRKLSIFLDEKLVKMLWFWTF